jgi:CheY-like chemotaxis protein
MSVAVKQLDVLVVESNPADTILTIAAFIAAGLPALPRCVREGQDAITYLLRKEPYSKVNIPDLIFLDLSQPRLASLEILSVIKSKPELMHIPIVVAAGSDDPTFVRAVYTLNGNCFIRKPDELTEFAQFIKTCYHFWGSIVTLVPPTGKRRRQ